MSGGRLGCLCPNSASCLWTNPASSYVELERGAATSSVKFGWRCSRCKGKTARYVGNLWKQTVLSSGHAPACELGCPYGLPHQGGTCGRSIPDNVGATFGNVDDFRVRVSLYKGPDFVVVHSTHVSSVVYLSLFVRETSALFTPPVGFRVGVCIWPSTAPGSIIPASHRTRLMIDGAECREGRLPLTFQIDQDRSVLMDQAPASLGRICGNFLSKGREFWARLFESPCALKRYGSLLHGHTHAGFRAPVASVVVAGAPAFPSPCPEVLSAACDISEAGAIRCIYCKKEYSDAAAYRKGCAPDLDCQEASDFVDYVRSETSVPHHV